MTPRLDLETHLLDCERRFDADAGLVGMKFKSPECHTRVPGGTWVHAVLYNFEYAVLALRLGPEDRRQRALAMLEKLLELQDRDPLSPFYGVWPWLLEESLERMAPPDWNWADFCGGRIAEILHESGRLLPEELSARLREALGHAAGAVFRRNVGAHYTNIAVMGGGVCAEAGELLGEPRLLDYGRRRLRGVLEHTENHGGFNEYNSPTYTMVVLTECERILHLVRDEESRRAAEQLRRMAWRTLAEHFHPPTGQWAGPHARAYQDRVDRYLLGQLRERTGLDFAGEVGDPEEVWTGPINRTVHPLPCPPEYLSAFREPPRGAVQRVFRFIRNKQDDRLSVRGTTWLTPRACLGSVSRDVLWSQRHPLIAYWRGNGAPCVVLRLRGLHDGRDFASALVRNAQAANRVLSAANLVTDLGDLHYNLDGAGPQGFSVKDLRWRYEISGPGVTAQDLGAGRYRLAAGDVAAWIHTLPGNFGPQTVRWELGGEEGRRWLDAVCYSGAEIRLRPEDVSGARLAAGLELLEEAAIPSSAGPRWENDRETASRVSWGDLALETPLRSEKY